MIIVAVIFFGLIILGMPIGYTLGIAGVAGLLQIGGDNFLVMAQLKQRGYKGSIGLQGYGCGGDVYGYLARSIKTFREIEKRLEEHPEWGKYDSHTTSHLASFRGKAQGI